MKEIYNKIALIREYIENGDYGNIFTKGQRYSITICENVLSYLPTDLWVISIAYTILMDHIFYDGNKRTAFLLICIYYNIDKELLANIISNCVQNHYTRETFINEVIYCVNKI